MTVLKEKLRFEEEMIKEIKEIMPAVILKRETFSEWLRELEDQLEMISIWRDTKDHLEYDYCRPCDYENEECKSCAVKKLIETLDYYL